jgi:hypothetical protein
MSRQAMGLFRKLCEVIARRRVAIMSVIGGLALGLSALTSLLQSPRPPEAPIEIQRKELHGRVQRVRDALHTVEGTPVDRVVGSRLAQWYNWGNWSNGWNKYKG